MLVQKNQVDKSRQAGFTLVELMVTIVIIGIVVALAAPSFQANRDQIAVERTANAFVSALTLARSSALSTRQEARVCFSVDGSACDGTGQPASWIVEARNRPDASKHDGFQISPLVVFNNPSPDIKISCLPTQAQFVYYDRDYMFANRTTVSKDELELQRPATSPVNGASVCTISVSRPGASSIQELVDINTAGLAKRR